jgi:predicted ATP-binding protein involved in virulence
VNQFENLKLAQWRQFGAVDIDLSRQSTVLTGANGCGKTTILNVLSHHFGWSINFVSTPYMGKKQKKRFYSDMRRLFKDELVDQPGAIEVGEIRYSNDTIAKLINPADHSNNPQYQLKYKGKQNVIGMHIPSHRPAITYQQIDQIPTNPKTTNSIIKNFNNFYYKLMDQLMFATLALS